MLRIAICDDEIDECKEIEQYIYQVADARFELNVCVFDSSSAFYDSLEKDCGYDIVFLDYEMAPYDGREIGIRIRDLGNMGCSIIYVSNHSEMIFELLDSQLFHFIEKPIEPDKFEKVFLSALHKATSPDNCLQVKVGKRYMMIPLREIAYVESEWRQVNIHTVHTKYQVYGKLDEIESQLDVPAKNFARVGKSFLVNLDFAAEIGSGSIIMRDGTDYTVSSTYKDTFMETCHQYIRRRSAWKS